ncbi:hypothetical protein Xen7305DRAFT_00046190 [Xenococcus sp. PCC 7305]|nr:hypothetical protein Xen7305DRAFT_00046190 [Xenococcus sp. PCC 7305]
MYQDLLLITYYFRAGALVQLRGSQESRVTCPRMGESFCCRKPNSSLN